MDNRIFFWNVMGRITLLILTSFLFIWFVQFVAVELFFTILTGTIIITLQVILLAKYVLSLSQVVEQFVASIGREEIPEIRFKTGRIAFKGLRERSNTIKQSMNRGRLEKEKYNQILIHVVNSADPGMICFKRNGSLLFMNETARSLVFNHEVAHFDDIRSINEKLWKTMRSIVPGTPRVIRLGSPMDRQMDFMREQLFSIRLKEVGILQETYKLFTLHNIQEELHKNETDSWQKIIRVLTHEIMNAVAPMLSMTKSLRNQLADKKKNEPANILDGLKVIESTGEGLIDFTEEYRRLALLPPPKMENFRILDTLKSILLLTETEAKELNVLISLKYEVPDAELNADKKQFEMILLNLLKNSFDALLERKNDRRVEISVLGKGDRMLIEVEDNGTGIPENLIDQVFVPFFSTKEEGSGIGLSLARQIMNNHEGSVYLESLPDVKTIVTLSFGINIEHH